MLVIPLASSKLISRAFFKSSSKELYSIRALRGCIGLGLEAKETLRSEGGPCDFLSSFSKQPSSTRTGCMMPRWGRGIDLLEHCWSNTLPQFLQWCFRFVKVKAVRHRMQTSLSAHSGGALLSTMLLATSTLGGKRKPSLWRLS